MWFIRKIPIVFIIVFLMEIEIVPCALAHKVTIFAYVEGGKVYTESYYSDGTRCRQSVIEVFNSSGKKILSGKTNEKGEFSFAPQTAGQLRLVLEASMGHRSETTLSRKDLIDGGVVSGKRGASNGELKMGKGKEHDVLLPQHRSLSGSKEVPSAGVSTDTEDLQKMLDQTLDKKLHPLMKLLVENQEKGVSARDVFAGIGYIFGLMGLVIYVRNIKKDNKRSTGQ